MCGIFINFSYKGKLLAPALKRADYFMNSLKSRGPDKSKTKILHNDSLFLGHTRLSIIDLRSIANQPMSDEKEQWCVLVFCYIPTINKGAEVQRLVDIRKFPKMQNVILKSIPKP